MAALDNDSIYKLQDKVLMLIFSEETNFYLTGGTCLNRFYYNQRYSDGLDLFTNANNQFRDDVRILLETFKSGSLSFEVKVDTRDFVRLLVENKMQVDLVNDRVYRVGKSILSPHGYKLDNELNICANKLCAIIGRDDPKDMFDLYTVFKNGNIDWKKAISAGIKKCILDPEVLEYRLSSFPLELLDLLKVTNPMTLSEMKSDFNGMVEQILQSIPR